MEVTMGSTNISVIGGREYVERMRLLAAQRRVSMAQLVRAALDEKYGDDLRELDSFFAQNVAHKQQIEAGKEHA
jgi:hypothetical protein